MNKQNVTLEINGGKEEINCYPMDRLLDVIREEANLTGTKEGCGEGECGACSIFLNGETILESLEL